MPTESPRLLLIDSYDSFTYNLAALCRRSIPGCSIHIIKNDQISASQLVPILSSFSAVIIGPGPGSPDNDQDVGILKYIWKLADKDVLPVFGVCLGLQSLALQFGATLQRLRVVKHGLISKIHHKGADLYDGVGTVEAVRYHSLHMVLQEGGDLECLAWADDGHENGNVVMAVQHSSKPFWAVQYHPESVRTRGGGEEVLRNFWLLAKKWSSTHSRFPQLWSTDVEIIVGKAWPHLDATPRSTGIVEDQERVVSTRIVESPIVTAIELCEVFGVSEEKNNFVLLDSAAQPGRFSIVGHLSPSSPKLSHRIKDHCVCIEQDHSIVLEDLGPRDVWSWLSSFMRLRRARGGCPEVPFWGGLIGFLSYELGTHSLSPSLPVEDTTQPDVSLVFVERSVVYDSHTGRAYVQSLLCDDDDWLSSTVALLMRSVGPQQTARSTTMGLSVSVSLPDKDTYIARILRAQELLYAGESYELCLTAPTRISVQQPPVVNGKSSSWELYKTLRGRNPAPHSGYMRLHPCTLISSSPERFLSFSRPPSPLCQLRPIKGTVRKGRGVTRAVAEEALIGSAKEVAENLMIVDLIRHDLHGVLGEDVAVKQFCGVEEYETVWQLVSVIEGRAAEDCHGLGWEVLRHSLPPGSMTGAPKKRSVELLHGLEGQPRSVYSGVAGYWDVGGGGDWAVVIRSCFTHGAEAGGRREWTLGAGGAITALSEAEAEWDEMMAKVDSVLRAFAGVA